MGNVVADHAATHDRASTVRNPLGQIEIQESSKREKKTQGGRNAFDRGRKGEATEGKDAQGGKDGDEPKGGKPEGKKNPSCEVSAHRSKKIVYPLRVVRVDPKDRIRRVKGEQAHPQDDRQKQEHDAPNLFPQ